MSDKCLQFAPLSSAVHTGFWWELCQKKLDDYKLTDIAIDIHGFYCNGDPQHISGRLNVDYTAFDETWQPPPRSFISTGSLYSKNTIEDFRECDKKLLLDTVAELIWNSIKSGDALKKPSLLSRFLLLTYVDLKKYNFYYWFAFPAVCFPESAYEIESPRKIMEYFSHLQVAAFLTAYDEFTKIGEDNGFFLLHVVEDKITLHPLNVFDTLYKQLGKVILGFCDPCTLERHPGWPLRNFLALISYIWPEEARELEVLCFRERFVDGQRDVNHSIILHLQLKNVQTPDVPGYVGWERNDKLRKGPRKVNLSASMDPRKLAESSVDLNLKLMRWRLVPSLNLEAIRGTRCLLLGAGTLGCNVARCLMGWGIRNITFVDNGNVSYSNPVRQSLYKFEDCIKGGKAKAEVAANSLQQIFPEIKAVGMTLSIPMPGHYVSESAVDQVRSDVTTLDSLIKSHDVIFLLTDTRESRWLPTVIAAANCKLVINAALGFDTFLVMRHGLRSKNNNEKEEGDSVINSKGALPSSQLGCYFCNDVVAPGDSTQNRSMDQQCTVTRPGISMIASALAVELMINVLQHAKRGYAPADSSILDDDGSRESVTSLGIIPHQIRGFLSRFNHILPVCSRFDKCTACSPAVLDEYKKEGFSFLLKAFNEPSFLEDLTGLTQLHVDTQEAEVWELSDDDGSDNCGSLEAEVQNLHIDSNE